MAEVINGRVTKGLLLEGKILKRPMPKNAALQEGVLLFLREKGCSFAPNCYGTDTEGHLLVDFIEGDVPNNIGDFTNAQIVHAAKLIRAMHDATALYPACAKGQVVCHGDLSPCNFVFQGGMPAYIIDWDAAHVGNAKTDLAYAIWMWLDIGNDELAPKEVQRRFSLMLTSYGANADGMKEKMLSEMQRVADSVFPTAEQTKATHDWAMGCKAWAEKFL